MTPPVVTLFEKYGAGARTGSQRFGEFLGSIPRPIRLQRHGPG